MKKKKSAFEIARSAFALIAVASLIIAWGLPDGKLGNVAGWVFLLLGFLPIQSYLAGYDNGGIREKATTYAVAIHLFSIFVMAIFFKAAREPFAAYVFCVLFVILICLNNYKARKCEDFEKQCTYLKEKLGERNESSRTEEIAER